MRKTINLNEITFSGIQRFIYHNKLGRAFLKLLIKPTVSKIAGAFLNTRVSKLIIKGFIKNNNIDMSEYIKTSYSSFNDFFTRKIDLSKRPMSDNKNDLISPSDSKLLVYEIADDLRFKIKNGYYDLTSFLDDETLAKEFSGGKLLVFRLQVDDYHRYCFIDNGKILSNKFIGSSLHTVQPIALEKDNYFKENCREITVINTENFGKIAVVEVGAMLVGRIVNHNSDTYCKKGEEKGYFEFGGSTVCVLLKKDVAELEEEIIINTKNNCETVVLFRETIGKKILDKN